MQRMLTLTTPFPYQVAGTRFLASRRGALLNDAVGLGKTYEAVWAVQEHTDIRHILVICPLIVKAQWIEVIKELAPPEVETDVEELVTNTWMLTERVGGNVVRTWVLAHYEQFINKGPYRAVFQDRGWSAVIVDEVHKIAGRKAQRTENILKLQSNYRWGLSGTIMRDRPQDMWLPLNWVAPQVFTSYWAFVQTYTETKPGYWGGIDIGNPQNLDHLKRVTQPYLLARTRQDVGQELPPLTIRPVHLTPEDAQGELYSKVSKEMIVSLKQEAERTAEGHIIWDFASGLPQQLVISNTVARFTRLHQVASHPSQFVEGVRGAKETWLRDYIESSREPCVILTRYNKTVALIKGILGDQASEWTVGTWDKLSHGLNLQRYNTLIAWDTTYKRLDWEQGIGRIERTGQTRPMTVFQLLLEDSVDLDIKATIDEKQEQVDMVLRWLRREFK